MGARAIGRRVAIGVAVVVLTAGIATTVHTRLELHRRGEQLHEDLASTRARTRAADDTLRSLRKAIAEATGQADDDQAEAKRIDGAVVRIGQLQAKIADAAGQLRSARAGEAQHQADLDTLQSCWRALDTAIAGLSAQPADPSAAVGALSAGDRSCGAALALAHGASAAVHTYDFADPSVLAAGGGFTAFGTNGPAGTVQLLLSGDLHHWTIGPDALPSLPSWARPGRTWAPSVHPLGWGYVMYYAVRSRATGKQCISRATSASPTGPYVDSSTGPLVCQTRLGGSIDPDLYTDFYGFPHLVWKSEGTSRQPAQLWSQYISGDGSTLIGDPHLLLTADLDWQDRVIENPSMVLSNGTWLLVYSANHWDSDKYATAYAVCASENGPCVTPDQPLLLTSTPTMAGPGGAQVFHRADGTAMVAWAAWDPGYVGFPNARRLHIGTFTVGADQRPVITETG